MAIRTITAKPRTTGLSVTCAGFRLVTVAFPHDGRRGIARSDVSFPERPTPAERPTRARSHLRGGSANVRFGGRSVVRPVADLVKVFGCRQASENRPCTNPRGCGDGLWGFRVLRGWGGCAAGSVRPLAAARCVRFVARRMTDWEPAAAERQQLSADPNARRTLGHSLQRDGVAA
jgi:hypothetical protein